MFVTWDYNVLREGLCCSLVLLMPFLLCFKIQGFHCSEGCFSASEVLQLHGI